MHSWAVVNWAQLTLRPRGSGAESVTGGAEGRRRIEVTAPGDAKAEAVNGGGDLPLHAAHRDQ